MTSKVLMTSASSDWEECDELEESADGDGMVFGGADKGNAVFVSTL